MSYDLNVNALNFSVDITEKDIDRLKKVKKEYKYPVNSYIRYVVIYLLKQIGFDLKNFDEFFPDKSKRKPYSFGESSMPPEYIELIKKIREEKGISRKEIVRKALDLNINSDDRNPESIAREAMSFKT